MKSAVKQGIKIVREKGLDIKEVVGDAGRAGDEVNKYINFIKYVRDLVQTKINKTIIINNKTDCLL
jgi:hypothetical protein